MDGSGGMEPVLTSRNWRQKDGVKSKARRKGKRRDAMVGSRGWKLRVRCSAKQCFYCRNREREREVATVEGMEIRNLSRMKKRLLGWQLGFIVVRD